MSHWSYIHSISFPFKNFYIYKKFHEHCLGKMLLVLKCSCSSPQRTVAMHSWDGASAHLPDSGASEVQVRPRHPGFAEPLDLTQALFPTELHLTIRQSVRSLHIMKKFWTKETNPGGFPITEGNTYFPWEDAQEIKIGFTEYKPIRTNHKRSVPGMMHAGTAALRW